MLAKFWPTAHVVYSVSWPGWMIYIGISPMPDLHRLADMRHNPMLVKIINSAEHAEKGTITILSIHATFDEAHEAYFRAYKVLQPAHDYKMRTKHVAKTNAKPVRCVTTGEEFASASQAAKANDINQSNLSKHLNEPHMYKSAGGMVYEWI